MPTVEILTTAQVPILLFLEIAHQSLLGHQTINFDDCKVAPEGYKG